MAVKIYQKNDETEFFPTPKEVVDELYKMLPGNAHYILDPCCGDGALDIYDDKYDYTLYDLVDRSNGKFSVNIGDFLKQLVRLAPNDEKFDAVIMNPPFGLCEKFIDKAFQFSDDIYVICPFKTIMKKYQNYLADYKLDWRWPCKFNVRVAIGILYLHKDKVFKLQSENLYAKFMKDKLPVDRTFQAAFYKASEAPKDKWFIVNRITMTRVERGHQLIQDKDIYKPGDSDAFIAICGNVNVKKGSKIDRNILTFSSFEAAKAFQKKYDDNDDYVRNYIYKYASQLLKLNQIPLL